jgi:thiol:disulfide interchange protein DsbA
MIRPFAALTAVLALCACARQETPPAPRPAPSAPSQALTPPPPASPPANAAGSQSESEEASASQESVGTEGEHKEKSDASLERIAARPPAAQLPAGKWQPGVNYSALLPAQPTSVSAGKVEVLEIFWFGCPRCYTLEPSLRAWQKSKPAYVQFVRVPVYWKGVQAAHARLFYTLVALNRQDLVAKAFDTIHNGPAGQAPPLFGATDADTLRQQQQFALANGVSAADFTTAYNSPGVSTALARADEITQRYRVEAVPLFAVNGKYTTDVSQAGSEDKLIALLDDLAAAEHNH